MGTYKISDYYWHSDLDGVPRQLFGRGASAQAESLFLEVDPRDPVTADYWLFSGTSRMTWVPRPGQDSNTNSPPSESMRSRMPTRPSPPPGGVPSLSRLVSTPQPLSTITTRTRCGCQ